jgi:hypothetical protein
LPPEGDVPVNETIADEVRSKLKAEIESFKALKEISTQINVPPPLLDSHLLLSGRDSTDAT